MRFPELTVREMRRGWAVVVAVGALSLLLTLVFMFGLSTTRNTRPVQVVLDPRAEAVAREFVATAVARRDLDLAWQLTTATLHAHLTKAKWLQGDIPVQPYPVAEATATFLAKPSQTNRALLEVVFYPHAGTRAQPGRFYIGLIRSATRWLVSSYSGSVRGCRDQGERDPDPGSTMLWC